MWIFSYHDLTMVGAEKPPCIPKECLADQVKQKMNVHVLATFASIDLVKILWSIQREIGHFGDVLSGQYLG